MAPSLKRKKPDAAAPAQPNREEALRLLAAEMLRQRKLKTAFKGIAAPSARAGMRAARAYELALEADAKTIRQAATLGHTTVAAISERTGLRRNRVRAVVKARGISAVKG